MATAQMAAPNALGFEVKLERVGKSQMAVWTWARTRIGDEMLYELSETEAFQAMTLFLRQCYERAGDDMGTLFADTSIEADGKTLDPAAWEDWIECVRRVKEDSTVR
jgi:hypothetical protein